MFKYVQMFFLNLLFGEQKSTFGQHPWHLLFHHELRLRCDFCRAPLRSVAYDHRGHRASKGSHPSPVQQRLRHFAGHAVTVVDSRHAVAPQQNGPS